jgi:hypothetical protein
MKCGTHRINMQRVARGGRAVYECYRCKPARRDSFYSAKEYCRHCQETYKKGTWHRC